MDPDETLKEIRWGLKFTDDLNNDLELRETATEVLLARVEELDQWA